MAWDFSTDPEFQKNLDWIEDVMENEIEPFSHLGMAAFSTEGREKFIKPLQNGEIRSAFSMSEPTGGSDPLTFKTRAVLEGDEWVINGEKWFSSGAYGSSVLVVYAVTDPDHKDPYQRTSIFLVPTDTPGVEIVRGIHVGAGPIGGPGGHGYMRY